MSEEVRQKWIGLVMDLLIEYHEMMEGHESLDRVFRPWCDRLADAAGGDATGEFVWELLQGRLNDVPR